MVDRLVLPAGVALLAAGFVRLAWLDAVNGTLRGDVVPSTIVWFLVAFVGFVLLIVAVQPRRRRAVEWRWLLLVGLGLRLLMLATEPTLSDDVYRYLWEGHLVTEGVSPYSFAIDDAAGDQYEIPARSLANNTSLASPYLPVAHGLFAAAALVLPSEPWTMQLLMIAFDVLAAAMIIKLLSLAGLPRRRVLLYWLNPLVILEVAHGAHLDAIIVGLVGAGLVLSLDRARRSPLAIYGGPLLIAAATLTRPLAVLLAPVLFWVWNWRQRATWAVALAAPILIAGASTSFGLEGTGVGVFGSARAYATTFRFNSALYQRLEGWTAGLGLDDRGWNEPGALTRLVVGVTVLTVLLCIFLLARRAQDERQYLRLLALTLIAYVLLTPVLHPWYLLLLLGLVPFVAPDFDEPRGRWILVAPWLLLSALLIFSYLTYQDPDAFGERTWVQRLEWYPTLTLLAIAGAWSVSRKRAMIDR